MAFSAFLSETGHTCEFIGPVMARMMFRFRYIKYPQEELECEEEEEESHPPGKPFRAFCKKIVLYGV